MYDEEYGYDPMELLVPELMNKVSDRLWVGGLPAARDEKLLKEAGITAVVNVCEWTYDTDRPYYWHTLVDGHGNGAEDLIPVIQKVHEFMEQGHTVLVHCAAGISRSPTICAAYLSYRHGHDIYLCLGQVAAARLYISPHFGIVHTANLALKEMGKFNGS